MSWVFPDAITCILHECSAPQMLFVTQGAVSNFDSAGSHTCSSSHRVVPTHLQAYFPRWLFGEWDVKAKLKAAQTPLGREALPKSLEQVGWQMQSVLQALQHVSGSAACFRQYHVQLSCICHILTAAGDLHPCISQIEHYDLHASQLHRKVHALCTG